MKKFRAMLVTAALVAGGLLPIAIATSASAHGWVTDPPSRQDYCASRTTSFDCGAVKYEPQSVEAPKGSLLCSGGNDQFRILDDNSRPWPRRTVASDLEITWKLTARHATSTWEYFVDGQLYKTVNDGGARPPATLTHTLYGLPTGDHTILARWNVADTGNAFYSCIDVRVTNDGSSDAPADGTTDGTSDAPADGTTDGTSDGSSDAPADGTSDGTTDGASDGASDGHADGTSDGHSDGHSDGTTEPVCTDPAWSAGAVYLGGTVVSHGGQVWKAKWWTRGDDPLQSGPWDVWQNLGACV